MGDFCLVLVKKFAVDTREIITNKVDFTVDYSVCTSPEMQEHLEKNAKDKKEYNTQNINDICDDILNTYSDAYNRIEQYSDLEHVSGMPIEMRDEYIARNITMQNANTEMCLLNSVILDIQRIKFGHKLVKVTPYYCTEKFAEDIKNGNIILNKE